MKYKVKKVTGHLAVKAIMSTAMTGALYEVGYKRVSFPRVTNRPAREFAVMYIYSK